MKRKVAALVVFIAVAVMSISGTMAYFTAEDIATNVITSGKIDIALEETELDANGEEIPYVNDKKGIMPGEDISKIVRVVNAEDAQDAYVRVKVVKTIILAPGVAGNVNTDLISFDLEPGWTQDGDYYYYDQPLAPGESTTPLFTSVTFSTAMGNMYQKCTATIEVKAEAVQFKNQNVDHAKDAAGWPEAE